jgi:hypothetical protein
MKSFLLTSAVPRLRIHRFSCQGYKTKDKDRFTLDAWNSGLQHWVLVPLGVCENIVWGIKIGEKKIFLDKH